MPALLDGLADACSNLGNTLTHLGAADEAVRLQREAVAHYEELVSTLPDRVDYLSGLGFATANLAAASIVHGEPGPAEGHYRRAIRHQRAAIDRQPGNLRALKFLGDHSAGLARLLRDQGRPEEAAEVIRAWVQLRPGDPGVLSRSACELALGLPSTPTGPDGEDPRRPLADEAIELLTRAVQSGWSDADAMARDPKLAPLRARADFTRLLESVQDRNFPADPFAR